MWQKTDGKILICFSPNLAPAQLLPIPSSLSTAMDTLGTLCASEALYMLTVSVYPQGVKMFREPIDISYCPRSSSWRKLSELIELPKSCKKASAGLKQIKRQLAFCAISGMEFLLPHPHFTLCMSLLLLHSTDAFWFSVLKPQIWHNGWCECNNGVTVLQVCIRGLII